MYLQIMVTDIEECIEALAANLAANLSEGAVTLSPPEQQKAESLSEKASNMTLDGWNAPRTVVDTIVQDMPLLLPGSTRASPDTDPVPHQTGQDIQERNEVQRKDDEATTGNDNSQNAIFLEHPSASRLVSGREASQSGSRIGRESRVTARVLDWKDGVESFHPPFDVILVADVVSLTMQA